MLKQEPQFSHIRISARRAWQRHLIAAVTKADSTPQTIGEAILAVPAKYSGVSVSEALSFVRTIGDVVRGDVEVSDVEDTGPGAL